MHAYRAAVGVVQNTSDIMEASGRMGRRPSFAQNQALLPMQLIRVEPRTG